MPFLLLERTGPMEIFTLASGSAGNCTLVTEGDTAVLIDAGISAKRITTALSQLGLSAAQLSGILITHEHTDHVCGLKTLLKHFEIPIFAPRTVANHLCWSIAGLETYLSLLVPGQDEQLGSFSVLPFRTPHDTPESVGYRLTGAAASFGLCTDLGHVTQEVLEGLSGVNAALIEANHDPDMLRNGSYPAMLKRRILSEHGHLSNEACGQLAAALFEGGTSSLVLGHLSRENNRPGLARETVGAALARAGADLENSFYLDAAPEKEPLRFPALRDCLC